MTITEIQYQTDSISKIISIFAIECAIVFGFFILLLFCGVSKMFNSNDLTAKDKFVFKKYSSKNKMTKDEIDILYKKESNDEFINSSNSSKTSKSCYSFFTWKKTNISKTNQIENEIKNNIKKEKEKDDSKEETKDTYDKSNENINKVKKDIQIEKFDIESGLNMNKIYIVYEFNNLDKSTNSSVYVKSESGVEFNELEEFVNMIIKSFESKYSQVGVLLKISSPGGVAFKFEHAYLNLLRLRDKKIELVGMVDKMAASGGYMLASACDKIICSRYATIGSVGVIAQMYNWTELNKKIGLEEKTWTTGSHKHPFPTGSSYTDEDNERMKEMIGETFDIFKSIINESRKFTPIQLEQILKAKTFSGFEAIQLNMVDELELSTDYIDKLATFTNVWICTKEDKSMSFITNLLSDNTKMLIPNIIEKIHNKLTSNIVDKKISSIKLM